MPTYQVRKTKQKKKGRGNITQIVSVVVQSGRGKTSRPRAPTQNLDKFMLTRPTPPQVITVPSMNPNPSPELARAIATQEKTLDLALQQQALLASRMAGGFQRDAEGVLQPSVSDMEKEALRQQLQEAQQQVSAQMTMMGDLLRKQEATAVRPPNEFVSAPPPAPPPPPPMTKTPPPEPEELDGGLEGLSPFQQELKKSVGKKPSELIKDEIVPEPEGEPLQEGEGTSKFDTDVAKWTKDMEGWSMRKLLSKMEGYKRVNKARLQAYINVLGMPEGSTRADILAYLRRKTGVKDYSTPPTLPRP